jgi:hypothetical protein
MYATVPSGELVHVNRDCGQEDRCVKEEEEEEEEEQEEECAESLIGPCYRV